MGYKSHAQRKAVHASKAEKKGASMKKFPEIKEKNEGKFTAWVEKNMPGTDNCKAASKIMKSKTKKYSASVKKMANYANNFGCKAKKEGASFNPKLKKAVADGKIKGKFAGAIMGSSMKDKDIKAAKKQIRKGANVSGGGNIIEDFGHKHGYQSAKTKELYNSRLVQRKKSHENKQEAKFNAESYKGKKAKKDWKSAEDLGGTAKSRNKFRKQEIKDIKQTAKTKNKSSKKYAKGSRIIAKAKKL